MSEEIYNSAKWDEASEEKSDASSIELTDEEISSCAKSLYEYIASQIKISNCVTDSDDTDVFLSISIPAKTHPLMRKLFDGSYTQDSRDGALEKLCTETESEANHDDFQSLQNAFLLSDLPLTVNSASKVVTQITVSEDIFMGDGEHNLFCDIVLSEP